MTLIPHNQAKNRYLFTGELTLKTGLHIGSGRGDFTTDSLVVMGFDKKPIIPGSSLRGVFRSHVERLIKTLHDMGFCPQLWSCQLFEPELHEKICVGSQTHAASKGQADTFIEQIKSNGLDSIWSVLDTNLCTTCQLFGAGTFWASKIRFSDLRMSSSEPEPYKVRHGVGINRDTGTAADQVKFDQQVVDSGIKFQFELLGENLTETDKMLLAIGFSDMISGALRIGGSTSRGLGAFSLSNGEDAIKYVNFSDASCVINYLITREYPLHQTYESFISEYLTFPSDTSGGEDEKTTP